MTLDFKAVAMHSVRRWQTRP